MHINDRQRVELAFPALVALDVLLQGVDDPSSYDAKATKALLAQAAREPFENLLDARRASLERRTERLLFDVMRPYRQEGALVAKMGLILFYLLQAIVETDYLILHEGGAMRQGLDLLLPALERAAAVAPLDQSARKQAAKVLQRLQWLGYYQGVTQGATNIANDPVEAS